MGSHYVYATKESFVLKFFILLFIFILASCSLTKKIISPATEVVTYGIKSKPPQYGSWYLAAETPKEIKFMSTHYKEEMIIAFIKTYQLPKLSSNEEFFEHVLKSSGQVTKASLNGAICSKNVAMPDTPKIHDADKTKKLMKFISYHCKHPKKSNVVVYMAYSVKHEPSSSYPLFQKHASDFFSNIVFTRN